MKRTIVKTLLASLTVVFLCFTGVLHAQEDSLKRSPEMRATTLTGKMKTRLTLSNEQYDKAYAVNLSYAKKNELIFNGDGSKLSKYKSLKSGNEAKTKEMKAILSKEQFDGYKAMQKEMREDAREAFKNSNS